MDQNSSLPIRAGRPTREHAAFRHEQLLDVALDHFLEKGFENSTIEAIASSVNMTKRTIYTLYEDKVSLFKAAVSRAIHKLTVSEEEMESTICDDYHETLVKIAHLRINRIMTATGLKLQRIININSYRFPELLMQNYEAGALPIINFFSKYLKMHDENGNFSVPNPDMAAIIFFSMVVSGPARIVISGIEISHEDLENRINYSINIYLNGIMK